MNLPVRVPVLDEAAALGAAVQALWCLESEKTGKTADIAALCAEHIKLDTEATTNPIPENVAAYDKAYDAYNTVLDAVKPLYI